MSGVTITLAIPVSVFHAQKQKTLSPFPGRWRTIYHPATLPKRRWYLAKIDRGA